jgi:hypothetical protein
LALSLNGYSKDPNCELIDYHEICTIDGHKLFIEETFVLQINNRLGDKYGKISIPYSKKIKVSLVMAQLEDTMGNIIRKIKNSEITDQSAISDFSLYEDHFIKKFELKHNIYPYRIRYSVRYTENEFQEISEWYPCEDNEVPTRYARLEIRTPLNYSVKFKSFKIPAPKIDTVENNIQYTFEVKNIKLPEEEIHCPPLMRLSPYVRVVPTVFTWVNTGSHENWTEYGNWLNKLILGTDELPETEKATVQTLIKGKTDKHDIIKTLYHYLQSKTRYINISVDIGGLKPYPAEYVIKNGYGDCKALSVYMKALLKTAGIPAYYTTIFAGDKYPDFMPDFPCHQSNHIITVVPLEKDTVFLDCTSNTLPAGYLGTFTQGRNAFVIDENNSKIVCTPELKLSDVKETRLYKFQIHLDNHCSLNISNDYRGENFEFFNSLNSDLNTTDAEDYIRERVIHLPGFELNSWKINKPDKDSAYIYFSAILSLQNYLKNYGPDLGLPLLETGIPKFEQPASRKLPVLFDYPIYKSDSLIYILPPSYKVKQMLDETELKSKFGTYFLKPALIGNTIIVYRELKIYRGEYPLSEYANLYSFVNTIYKTEKKMFLLSKQ